ncbi:hypothetical protein predicted by Glimmer/Critica [Sorangium cellulosum So ce56]|uniref:Uncharacterized protein n=1 Tax=Sorangium cellulosum (strain So ce56) TaxID=448385 RepID=A9GBC5_SORC5|nr:hypothetical protein predicted by Glimmer/Critica [Sorangium cellulosum So ce56]
MGKAKVRPRAAVADPPPATHSPPPSANAFGRR